ncbi:MAG: GNAT family N-acetyltransferase [Qingshengfaniella sp.]
MTTTPVPAPLLALDTILAETWPAAETCTLGPLTLRRSPGGGQRVQAASLTGEALPTAQTLTTAAEIMDDWGQTPLYRVDDGQEGFDTLLDGAGYVQCDPTVLRIGHLAPLLAIEVPPVSNFSIWPPLAIIQDMWRTAGHGPDRIAVMHRVPGARTALLARHTDRPVGVSFVATSGKTAVVHALDVVPTFRGQGIARRMMARAARWAQAQGLTRIAALVTTDNTPAQKLYQSLGMEPAGGYHYRRLKR